VIGSLLADILYAAADPRIRLGAPDMATTDDFDVDPVFNDQEEVMPLPIGGGETMASATRSIRTRNPEGGESRSTGTIFRQMSRVFLEKQVGGGRPRGDRPHDPVLLRRPPRLPNQPDLHPARPPELDLECRPLEREPARHRRGGFDILGRLMYGGQVSLIVGFASAIVATVVGVTYGAMAGFFGGWSDSLLMRVVDVLLSIPVLFLLIALVTIYHQSELLLILVIAFVSWLIRPGSSVARRCRCDCASTSRPCASWAAAASASLAATSSRNAVGTIVVFATFQIADSILLLAALGYLGLGVPAPRRTGAPCSRTA